MKTALRHLVLALIGATLALVAASAPASASGYFPSYAKSNYDQYVPMRMCPDAGCPRDGYVKNNTAVRMVCYMDWGWASGNYGSYRWFKVTDEPTGYTRWVHSSFIFKQTPTPTC